MDGRFQVEVPSSPFLSRTSNIPKQMPLAGANNDRRSVRFHTVLTSSMRNFGTQQNDPGLLFPAFRDHETRRVAEKSSCTVGKGLARRTSAISKNKCCIFATPSQSPLKGGERISPPLKRESEGGAARSFNATKSESRSCLFETVLVPVSEIPRTIRHDGPDGALGNIEVFNSTNMSSLRDFLKKLLKRYQKLGRKSIIGHKGTETRRKTY